MQSYRMRNWYFCSKNLVQIGFVCLALAELLCDTKACGAEMARFWWVLWRYIVPGVVGCRFSRFHLQLCCKCSKCRSKYVSNPPVVCHWDRDRACLRCLRTLETFHIKCQSQVTWQQFVRYKEITATIDLPSILCTMSCYHNAVFRDVARLFREMPPHQILCQ